MSEQHINLEELAAFIDGKLTGERRARMVRLLAESDEAYQVFAETVRFREEEEAEPKVIRFPEERRWNQRVAAALEVAAARWKVWVPAAAAAAVALVLGVQTATRMGAPAGIRLASAELVASFAERPDLGAQLGPDWDLRTWSVTRGGPARVVEPETAFRLGVRAVDLHVAMALRDALQASRLLAEMLDWLSGVEMSQAVAAQYADLRSRVASEPAGALTATLAAAEQDLETLLASPRFVFGKWVGAAELAARVRDRSFFTSPFTARLFEAVGQLDLDDADVAAMRRIADLTMVDVGDARYQELQGLLQEIIRRNAG